MTENESLQTLFGFVPMTRAERAAHIERVRAPKRFMRANSRWFVVNRKYTERHRHPPFIGAVITPCPLPLIFERVPQ